MLNIKILSITEHNTVVEVDDFSINFVIIDIQLLLTDIYVHHFTFLDIYDHNINDIIFILINKVLNLASHGGANL